MATQRGKSFAADMRGQSVEKKNRPLPARVGVRLSLDPYIVQALKAGSKAPLDQQLMNILMDHPRIQEAQGYNAGDRLASSSPWVDEPPQPNTAALYGTTVFPKPSQVDPGIATRAPNIGPDPMLSPSQTDMYTYRHRLRQFSKPRTY